MTGFVSPFTGDVIQPTDVSYRAIDLAADTVLAWPINGNATDNAAARIMDVTPESAGLTIFMPPANQTTVGNDSLVRNVGGYSFQIADYDGNLICTVDATKANYIYVTANNTTAGSWGLIAFGVGTASVDAATLAGFGLKAISTTLNTAHVVTSFSSNYTAISSDRAASYVWTGGAGTLALTLADTLGNDWFMLVRNNGTGTLTVSPDGDALINSASTIALQPSDSCVICCSGVAFFTVGLGRSAQFNFTQLTKAVQSGSYTLTSSEASNVIQKYTGTLTGDVIVVLPQTIQVYYITNQTDGTGAGYTITFTTGIGGDIAIIPAGQQVILLCDSVNLLNASTIAAGASNISLASGSAGAPSLNFASETSTGVYRPGTGEFGISILGVQLFGLTAAGLNISGIGNFTGGILGGTFS
jgi:hypothetical protein